jgi:4-hydroxy 2-oxovalerate aldolase
MTRILDCTLRDGGYYNDWHFPLENARRTVESLYSAGVDIIEVGLKSAFDEKCSGLFKYCNEDYLEFLGEFPDASFSFMINVKEFVQDGRLDEAGLDRIIRPAEDSRFTLCRLATHYADIERVADFVRYFRGEGYQVGVNLMGISLLDEAQIEHAMTLVEGMRPDVFYIADSFGSMLPENISGLLTILRRHYNGPVGIHTHDNQGLAFANTLRALDEGVEYIDATLTGMGRGAGNLSTEQILLWLQNRGDDRQRYHPSRVLDVIHDIYQPMKDHYRWGFNYVYMLSGLSNIHPVYCMELCDGGRFSMSQISSILENIPPQNRAVFNRPSLGDAINATPRSAVADGKQLALFRPDSDDRGGSACLVVSTGSDIQHYREAVCNLLRRRDLPVIECNHTGILGDFPERTGVVLNGMRLAEIARLESGLPKRIITGEKRFDQPIDTILEHFPFRIGDHAVDAEIVSLPDFEAGQYAISMALVLGYREIHLAGFSGYDEAHRNLPMEEYFAAVRAMPDRPQLISITPTRYENLRQRSIFTL